MLKIHDVMSMLEHIVEGVLPPQVCFIYDQQVFFRNWSYSIWWNYIIWPETPFHFIWKQVYGLGRKHKPKFFQVLFKFHKATPCIELPRSLRPFWLYGVWNKNKTNPMFFYSDLKKISKWSPWVFFPSTYCCVLPFEWLLSITSEVSWILANCKKTVSYWDYSSSLRLALLVGPAIIKSWRWRQDLTFKWCIWSTQWSILYKCKWTEIWHCKSSATCAIRKEIRIKSAAHSRTLSSAPGEKRFKETWFGDSDLWRV